MFQGTEATEGTESTQRNEETEQETFFSVSLFLCVIPFPPSTPLPHAVRILTFSTTDRARSTASSRVAPVVITKPARFV